uniref:WGS project CBMG000000000 data, contig CS5907-c001023 n=1 Tax=Fusarium acuminatum CS5907 TaxID=1318461 RepID=A0A096PFH9_9HYPO|nr:unnamed protein product [Fusarium acuminatum CS5907]
MPSTVPRFSLKRTMGSAAMMPNESGPSRANMTEQGSQTSVGNSDEGDLPGIGVDAEGSEARTPEVSGKWPMASGKARRVRLPGNGKPWVLVPGLSDRYGPESGDRKSQAMVMSVAPHTGQVPLKDPLLACSPPV